MAKQGDNELSALYGARYSTPTFHSQATAFGLSAGCLDSGDGSISNRVSPEGEARLALFPADILVFQKLGLAGEIQRRTDGFERIWGLRQ